MAQNTALTVVNRGIMLGEGASLDDLLAVDRTPKAFSSLIYFAPVQKEELRQLLATPIEYKSSEYQRLVHIKRRQLSELYNGVAAFMLAIVNVDAVERLRISRSMLNERMNSSNPELQELNRLADYAESYISQLAQFPINIEACKALSDVAQAYDAIVCEKMQGPARDAGIYDIMKLYVKYGVSRDSTMFDSFEKIMSYLEAAGFGYSHYAWSPDKGEDRYSELAQDTLRLHLWTQNKVLFHLQFRPSSDKEIREIYGLKDDAHVPSPLEPMELLVTTRDEKTPNATLLENARLRLMKQFNHSVIQMNGRERPILYCPPISLLAA